ncbi:MAG: hypothetical protein PHD74_02390 [Candidatus Krumholzibacteria bacterium]|nr:hypothetical protein [Candidatus Krumholzibacteria bacterium]
MLKLYKSFVVIILLTGILASCHGKVEETYVLTSLKNATNGTVLSIGFKYSFDSPNVVGAANNVALVREGNEIEFFIGEGLAAKLKDAEGKKIAIGARKYFTPYIHYVVDFLAAGTDTIQVGEPSNVKLPLLRPLAQFTAPEEYESVELNKLSPALGDLQGIKEKKFRVDNAKVTYDQVTEGGVTNPYYSINLKNVRFFVEDNNDVVLAVLDAIMREGKVFEGGVQYTSIPTSLSRDFRERLKAGGKIKIGYIMYGGNAVTFAI